MTLREYIEYEIVCCENMIKEFEKSIIPPAVISNYIGRIMAYKEVLDVMKEIDGA